MKPRAKDPFLHAQVATSPERLLESVSLGEGPTYSTTQAHVPARQNGSVPLLSQTDDAFSVQDKRSEQRITAFIEIKETCTQQKTDAIQKATWSDHLHAIILL